MRLAPGDTAQVAAPLRAAALYPGKGAQVAAPLRAAAL